MDKVESGQQVKYAWRVTTLIPAGGVVDVRPGTSLIQRAFPAGFWAELKGLLVLLPFVVTSPS